MNIISLDAVRLARLKADAERAIRANDRDALNRAQDAIWNVYQRNLAEFRIAYGHPPERRKWP